MAQPIRTLEEFARNGACLDASPDCFRVLSIADIRNNHELMTFDDLSTELGALPNCRDYDATTYKPFEAQEFALVIRSPNNKADIAKATDILCRSYVECIKMYHMGLGGKPLCWRIRPEIDIWTGQVIEHLNDGPDMDHMVDRRCVKDYAHVLIKIRSRFLRENDE